MSPYSPLGSNQTSTVLSNQLEQFVSLQEGNCSNQFSSLQEKELIAHSFIWARKFATQYLQSREQRATESISPEVHATRELARKYIGEKTHDFFATCIDGRTMPLVMFSRPPHIGGVLRAPAGIVQGFMRGVKPGTVRIDYESLIVSRITQLLLSKKGENIFYGFDSHFGCAARKQIHDRRGGHEKDGGLRSDVISKLMMAQGLLELREELVAQGNDPAKVIPTFFSFDPHSGYVTAGLEMHVDLPEVVTFGYTPEVIADLQERGLIVQTEKLMQYEKIHRELETVLQPNSADFRKSFPQSLLRNWQALMKLYADGEGSSFKVVLKHVTQMYVNSGWEVGEVNNIKAKKIAVRTVQQKAKFLLKNIVTRYSIAGTGDHWPFENHKEDLVVITEGGYAPFPSLDAFAVYSQDLEALLPNTQLAIELIRSFRATGKVTDPTNLFKTDVAFQSAPVFVSSKAILRFADTHIWERLQKLKLAEVFAKIDWDSKEVLNWGRAEMLTALNTISNISDIDFSLPLASAFVDVLYEVFHRMRLMMKNKVFREMLLRGEIIVLSTIVDSNRQPRLIIPIVV